MIFPEAMTRLEQYAEFTRVVKVPVLANITEFGATPLFTTEQLSGVGIKLVLYPLSAFRAMSQAALDVYRHILADGTQQQVIPAMQTRAELYDFLGYHAYEQQLDRLFAEKGTE
jgi:methylisocitrate lyase